MFICCRVWLCRFARSERLLKVLNDIVNVLSANRNTDEVVRDTAICLFLVAELLMRRCPGVNSQSLGVTNTGQRLDRASTGEEEVGEHTWLDWIST